jgi:filamentous hemagglutinin family protein
MKRIAGRRQDRFLFERRLIAVAVMSALSNYAGANPTDPQVVNGQVCFGTKGSVLTVTNSPNAIINWQSFSIGSKETTRFVQQNAASAVLNRVVGVDPSVILGTLQSNGKVFLINTNGILFGQGARVDVAGLVASTLNLNDADFLAGRLNFQSSPLGNGSVVNRGTIATPEGGSVFLVGAAVQNKGIIRAAGGEVILAAGQTVRLGSTGAPNVLVEVQAPENRAVNLGEIAVGAGKAGIYGGFVEQKGIVSANTATVNAAGKIVFRASRDTTLAAGSSTTASGAQGGTVAVESDGTTFVEGLVGATGASGKGGKIQLLGEQVAVTGRAVADASGASGGGAILVGGDYKGGNREVTNARTTFIGPDAQLKADATGAGTGGRVVVWSDEVTRAYGHASARGGPLGGQGGFVETSSAGFLEVLRAPDVGTGSWLIDAYDIIVSSVSSRLVNSTPAPIFTPNGNTSTIGADLIGAQLSAGGSVTLETSGVGSQQRNITVQGSILKKAGGASSLTLKAHNSIALQSGARIESSAGTLAVTLNSDEDASGTGAIWMQSGSSIITNGGDVVMGGGADPLTIPASASPVDGLTAGVRIDGTVLSSAGEVRVLGRGSNGTFRSAVAIGNGGLIQSTTGNITVVGSQPDQTNATNVGGLLLFGGTVRTATGSIDLRGSGPGSACSRAGSNNTGVILDQGAVVEVTGTGHVSIYGDAGFATYGGNTGVMVTGGSSVLADGGGSIAISGTPGDPGDAADSRFNSGVAIFATVRAAGAGTVDIVGLAPTGPVGDQSQGVAIQGTGALVEACGAATIAITGTGPDVTNTSASGGALGVFILQGGQVKSQAGGITIAGTGGSTTRFGDGVAIVDAGSSVATVDGLIQITGIGGGTLTKPSGRSADGVAVQNGATIRATGAGSVNISGTSGVVAGVFNPSYGRLATNGATAANGVSITGGGQVATNSGALTIVGMGTDIQSDALGTQGVIIANAGSSVHSSSGNVSITGTGSGTAPNRSGGDTSAIVKTTAGGSISLDGTGAGTAANPIRGNSSGIAIVDGANITTLAGSITGNAGGTLLVNGANLSATSISLSGGDIMVANARIGQSTTTSLQVDTPGQLTVDGTNGPAKLFSGGTVGIRAGSVRVRGGRFSASIDPTDLDLKVPGDVILAGGSGANASAEIRGNSVSLGAGNVTLRGGSGERSSATIQARDGNAQIDVSNNITMARGTGAYASASMWATGALTVTAVSCNGCAVLSDDPLLSSTAQAGLFGNPVRLTLAPGGLLGNPVRLTPAPGLVQVPSSVIVGVETAQGDGESRAVLSGQEREKWKRQEQAVEQGGAREEHGERRLQICM